MNNPWQKITPPDKDVAALRVSAEHPLNLFWGKDFSGNYLFIYEYSPESQLDLNKLPKLNGIELINVERFSRLVLILKNSQSWELFRSLCYDLITATKSIKDEIRAARKIINRLAQWQDFFKKNRADLLTEDAIKGLIGELLFLKIYLISEFGPKAVDFWFGPEQLPQDFNLNSTSVEVKCQMGGTSPTVKISSIDQLYSTLPNLFLYVVTLGKSTADNKDAINLPSLIEEISTVIESETIAYARFEVLLTKAGYFYNEYYDEFNYLLADESAFKVIDGFPRVVPNLIPSGIKRLNYHIELAACTNFKIGLEDLELK